MWRRSTQRLCHFLGNENPMGCSVFSLPSLEEGSNVVLRGRVASSKIKGKLGFMQLRQPPSATVQVVVSDDAELLSQAKAVTKESIVEVSGKLTRPEKPIESATVTDVEINLNSLKVISAAESPLPFPIKEKMAKLDTRLDHRPYDLRTMNNAAIFRIQSAVTNLYRRYMTNKEYVEIHTPKIISTPSEGGSAVFTLDYFDKPAYLAQSPQLFKQMAVQGDFSKVIEIGPVFRAENSNTHRHLTEYIGLDAEMVIRDSYHEVLDELESVVVYIITTLQTEYASHIHAATDGEYSVLVPTVPDNIVQELMLGDDTAGIESGDKFGARVGAGDCPVLRMTFDNAVKLLQEHKVLPADEDIDDFNSAVEKKLGMIIKERYGVDVFLLDQYRISARPFYTMPSGDKHSRSYDLFVRGEEICSGAQRIHDVDLLLERAKVCRVNTELIKDYVNAFRFGAWPHGGFGIGLERLVMLMLGLKDVRYASMFPRDPKRVAP